MPEEIKLVDVELAFLWVTVKAGIAKGIHDEVNMTCMLSDCLGPDDNVIQVDMANGPDVFT